MAYQLAGGPNQTLDDNRIKRWKCIYAAGVLRAIVDCASKADICEEAQLCSAFVRSLKDAKSDAFLLLDAADAQDLLLDLADKLFTILGSINDDHDPKIVEIGVKSFAWKQDLDGRNSNKYKHCFATIEMTPQQRQSCQGLFISNTAHNEFCAYLPRAYFRFASIQPDTKRLYLTFGSVRSTQYAFLPLPTALSHCVMRKKDIPAMLESVVAHA